MTYCYELYKYVIKRCECLYTNSVYCTKYTNYINDKYYDESFHQIWLIKRQTHNAYDIINKV